LPPALSEAPYMVRRFRPLTHANNLPSARTCLFGKIPRNLGQQVNQPAICPLPVSSVSHVTLRGIELVPLALLSGVPKSSESRCSVSFCRVYHIDAKGETAGLTNFRTTRDAFACARALAIMAASKWPGAELWEGRRQVHCAGVARKWPMPAFPSQDIASPNVLGSLECPKFPLI
jgi:hypothetical protein